MFMNAPRNNGMIMRSIAKVWSNNQCTEILSMIDGRNHASSENQFTDQFQPGSRFKLDSFHIAANSKTLIAENLNRSRNI
jgi:hypothetical protein